MNVSCRWLKNYVDFSLAPSELAAKLTMAGLEVESFTSTGAVPAGVVTAKILSRSKHENSDHLSVCQVDKGDEQLQIVCGAPNCDAGNVVPLATIGTVFPDGDKTFTIKKGKLRGVESFGMMCSARELGLGSDHDGLMILPADTPIGIPMNDIIDSDTVYDCSVTPNRPDWLSHVGVARDLAALMNVPLKLEKVNAPRPEAKEDASLVTLEAKDVCTLYAARVIKGVKVAPSPEWMQKALSSVGVRPINNIVDVTNFVMMEQGVPLHAFDVRNLAGGRIVVRKASNGESIVALDGKKYDLSDKDLCICDEAKPVAIAGIMGGEYSGIQDDTTTVVLESAWFDPDSVRLTSRRLGLASDASHRYERGVDRGNVVNAGFRALSLILELAGGEYVSYCEARGEEPSEKVIPGDFDRIRGILGMEVDDGTIKSILARLGFEEVAGRGFKVPSWRTFDVVGVADLAEEVARIHGLDKIPEVAVNAVTADYKLDACKVAETLRSQLTGVGLDEIVSESMIDEVSATADGIYAPGDLVKVSNPISRELAVMRPSIVPGLLDCVRRNVARKNPDIAIFETGHVFCANKDKAPEERDELGIAITGHVHPERYSSERKAVYDFFDLKGAVEAFLEAHRIEKYSFKACEDPRFKKGVCASLEINGKQAGVLGETVPALTKGMRLTTPLYMAVIDIDALLNAKERSALYQALSQYPSTSRDVAFIAPAELTCAQVTDFIRKAHLPDLEDVKIFDLFEDEKAIGKGKKSMAFTLSFRSMTRTLTDQEVNASFEKLRIKLEKGLGVELR